MKNPELPIVLVDDESSALFTMSMALKMAGFDNIVSCSPEDDVMVKINTHGADIVVLDIIMPNGISGFDLLKSIKLKDPGIPVIMATGVNEIDTAVQCMKNGAYDYIIKPLETDRFISGIKHALNIRQLDRDYQTLSESMLSDSIKNPEIFSEIQTNNPCMMTIFKYIEAIGPSTHPVLITGETGTGKELAAKALHKTSGLTGAFIALNAAGLDDNVFSDTLFGHCKGAFTGADKPRAGLVEAAAGGTLFLDEIGDLSLQSQVKLLRLIQEREYHQIGSDFPKTCNARIITATCKNINALSDSENFRKDLFFRLRTHHIHLPPLRDRKDDLELLTQTFLAKASLARKKNKPTVPPELYTLLKTYNFPGNIRELEGMVNDAVSLHNGHILSLNVFRHRTGIASDSTQYTAQKKNEPSKISFPDKLPSLHETENMLVNEAMLRTNGNQSMAAQLLGITRQALSYRLKKTDKQ